MRAERSTVAIKAPAHSITTRKERALGYEIPLIINAVAG
jgi:hypothetical protein